MRRSAVGVAALAVFGAVAVSGAPPAAAPPPAAAAPPLVAVRPVPGRLVRAFDPPASPWGAGHRGADLAARPGDPVVAALAGTVAFAGVVAGTGWVTVAHHGGLSTTYGDLDPRLVHRGQPVARGQVIGRLAAAARHLDWGARLDGRYLDPLSLLATWEVRLVAAAS